MRAQRVEGWRPAARSGTNQACSAAMYGHLCAPGSVRCAVLCCAAPTLLIHVAHVEVAPRTQQAARSNHVVTVFVPGVAACRTQRWVGSSALGMHCSFYVSASSHCPAHAGRGLLHLSIPCAPAAVCLIRVHPCPLPLLQVFEPYAPGGLLRARMIRDHCYGFVTFKVGVCVMRMMRGK